LEPDISEVSVRVASQFHHVDLSWFQVGFNFFQHGLESRDGVTLVMHRLDEYAMGVITDSDKKLGVLRGPCGYTHWHDVDTYLVCSLWDFRDSGSAVRDALDGSQCTALTFVR
jgi:hypothetical protein